MSTTLFYTTILLICLSLSNALICNVAQQACANQCYYPIAHQCVDGHICKIGQKVCGSQCYYDLGLNDCLDGRLCKLGQKLCNGQCYYPVGQRCIKREYLV